MPLPDIDNLTPDELRALTDEDLQALLGEVYAEVQRRQTLVTAESDARDAAERYERAVTDDEALEWAEGMVIGPGQRVIEDGDEYRNVSGAWLSVPPSAYRMGYQLTTPPDPDADDVAPFAAGEAVEVGDRRSYDGVVYVVLQAHTTQADWTPPAVPALWAVA